MTSNEAASNPPPSRAAVAAEVRAAIAKQGKSAAEVATETGISRSSLSRKLRGLVPFYVDEILSIGEFLSVDPSTFVAVAA